MGIYEIRFCATCITHTGILNAVPLEHKIRFTEYNFVVHLFIMHLFCLGSFILHYTILKHLTLFLFIAYIHLRHTVPLSGFSFLSASSFFPHFHRLRRRRRHCRIGCCRHRLPFDFVFQNMQVHCMTSSNGMQRFDSMFNIFMSLLMLLCCFCDCNCCYVPSMLSLLALL